MTFDFGSFLSTLYPGSEFEIQVLTGGLVNNTVRARRTLGIAGYESLILKHAPPYVAIAGPAMPFSQERQDVEAAALALFSAEGPLSLLVDPSSDSGVVIPRLIHHDPEAFIIVLEDFGPLGTLWDLINGNFDCNDDADLLNATFGDIGHRVGQFFARLHAPKNPVIVSKDSQTASETLSHSLTDQLVFDAAVEVILDRLNQHSIPDAQRLYERVVNDYRSPQHEYAPSISLGDFHPGSILTETRLRDTAMDGDCTRTVALIDWEFASVKGRGVNGDMAQFLAWIRCQLIVLSPQTPVYEGIQTFVRSLCGAYARGMGYDLRKDETAQLLRSSLILHGREIINQAFDKEWGVDPSRLNEMVRVGAWYLKRAGDDVGQMLAGENWKKLESQPGDMILGLFQSS